MLLPPWLCCAHNQKDLAWGGEKGMLIEVVEDEVEQLTDVKGQ